MEKLEGSKEASEIERIRKEIDEIDARIAEEIRKRFDAVKRLAIVKKEKNMLLEDNEREKKVHENYKRELKNFENFAEKLAAMIINQSKEIQRKIIESKEK